MRLYLGPYVWSGAGWELPDGCFSSIDLRVIDDMGPDAAGQKNVGVFAVDDDAATFGPDYRAIDAFAGGQVPLTDRQWLADALGLGFVPTDGSLARIIGELLGERSDPEGGRLPLIPGVDLRYRIRLAGHEVAWAWQPTGPHWDRVLFAQQQSYRRQWQDVQHGRERGGQHRKWLGYQAEKYFGRFDDSRADLMRARSVPHEWPLRPETVITDDFSGTLSAWTDATGEGEWTIETGQVKHAGTSGTADWLRHNTSLSSDDHYVQIDFTERDAGSGFESLRVIGRKDPNSTNTYYALKVRGTSGGPRVLEKVLAGTPTTLASDSLSSNPPFTPKLTLDGSAIEGFVDGGSILSATDSAITGNLRTGLGSDAGSGTRYIKGDNFEAGDLHPIGITFRCSLLGVGG